MWAGATKTVTDVISSSGALYDRLWQPLMIAALNTDPHEGSARLAGAVMRNTLAKGGAACRPLVAEGLSAAFIDPALDYLNARGNAVAFGRRLREISFEQQRVRALKFSDGEIAVGEGESIVLAVPPWVAQSFLPGLRAPNKFRSILNAHYSTEAPNNFPPLLGLIHGTVEWIFAFPGRISVTISGADRLIDVSREQLAADLWREVATVTGLPSDLPPWQIVKEKRATFAANSRSRRLASGYKNEVAQPFSRGRLDTNRPARNHRRRDPIWRAGRASGYEGIAGERTHHARG